MSKKSLLWNNIDYGDTFIYYDKGGKELAIVDNSISGCYVGVKVCDIDDNEYIYDVGMHMVFSDIHNYEFYLIKV